MGDGTGAHCPGAGEGTSTKLEWEKGHVIGKENRCRRAFDYFAIYLFRGLFARSWSP